MADWTFTFCDLLTDVELATLPVTGASMERVLSSAAPFGGYLSLVDEKVRRRDPWSATVPKRTALYVELGDQLLWSGVLWDRTRSAGSFGMSLVGATWESYLAARMLTADLMTTQKSAAEALALALAQIQQQPNGNVGIAVAGSGTPAKRDRTWLAADAKTILGLAELYTETQKPIEYTFEVQRRASGDGFSKTLLVGEPRLGRRAADELELAYPDGGLEDFTDSDDATGAPTALFGVGGQDPNAADPNARLTVYRTATDVSSDELQAGFPLLQKPYSANDATTLADLTDATDAELIKGLASPGQLSGLRVNPGHPLFGFGRYFLGDDITLQITHPAWPEFPDAWSSRARILGDKVTQGSSSSPDRLELTIGPDARVPKSLTLPSTLGDILKRITALETA